MDYFRRFTFLFAMPTFDADDLEGIRLNQIVDEIERSGFEVVKARKMEDAEIAVQTDAAIGCMVVDWGKKGLEGKTAALINLMRRRGLDFPIILLIRRKSASIRDCQPGPAALKRLSTSSESLMLVATFGCSDLGRPRRTSLPRS